jgi:uncharacterized membrane protein
MKKEDFFPLFVEWLISKGCKDIEKYPEELLIALWDRWIFYKSERIVMGLMIIFVSLIPPLIAGTAVLSFQIGLFFSMGIIKIPLWLFCCFAVAPVTIFLLTFFIFSAVRLKTIAPIGENGESVDGISLKEYIKENLPES